MKNSFFKNVLFLRLFGLTFFIATSMVLSAQNQVKGELPTGQTVSFNQVSYSTCPTQLPTGHYAIGTNFFREFWRVIAKMAYLKANGFEKVYYTHTSCQKSDVLTEDLFIILISDPVATEQELYPLIYDAQILATNRGITLDATRVIHFD